MPPTPGLLHSRPCWATVGRCSSCAPWPPGAGNRGRGVPTSGCTALAPHVAGASPTRSSWPWSQRRRAVMPVPLRSLFAMAGEAWGSGHPLPAPVCGPTDPETRLAFWGSAARLLWGPAQARRAPGPQKPLSLWAPSACETAAPEPGGYVVPRAAVTGSPRRSRICRPFPGGFFLALAGIQGRGQRDDEGGGTRGQWLPRGLPDAVW